MQGMYVTGQNQSYPNKKFNHITNIEPINLKRAHILKEKPTSEITLKAVLNSNTETNESGEYKTYINIYNTDGQIEKINISFNKKDKNKWTVNVQSDDDKNKSINNTFELNFDSHGKLIKNSRFVIESKDSKYEKITLNLTDSIEQSDIDNSWEEYFQNGYARGSLKTFNILPNGEIVGTYSNQKEQTIGQILLSKFTSPEKLQPESGNLWSATTASGKEKIGIAGNNGFGVLSKQTLEASNVDLNKELINMIIAQRNYQSNAQSFKTEDKIISTLINLR